MWYLNIIRIVLLVQFVLLCHQRSNVLSDNNGYLFSILLVGPMLCTNFCKQFRLEFLTSVNFNLLLSLVRHGKLHIV